MGQAPRRWEHLEMRRDGECLRVTAVPAVHGPGPISRMLLAPVIGTVLELERPSAPTLRLYGTGDTLFRPHLARTLADRFPPLDAMVLHLGGTRLLGLLLTMDARQGAGLVQALRPPVTIPVHYDDYPVFRSPLADFLSAAQSGAGAHGMPRTACCQRTVAVQLGGDGPVPALVSLTVWQVMAFAT